MSTLFAFLHHVCAFTLVSAVAIEFALIRGELTLSSARRLQVTDMVLGMAAGVWGWRTGLSKGHVVTWVFVTLVFGLPGNPVSSLVAFELFVRPALLALQGAREPGPAYLPGRLGQTVRRNEHRDELVRARTRIEDGAVVLDPLTGQESHMIVRSAAASALVLVPRGTGDVSEGARVSYLRI